MSRNVTALAIPVGEHDHALGPDSAAVTLVEFGDFQCPYCADAHPMLKRIAAAMGANLRFVFRHMVMMEIHPFAQFAAEAAEAAHLQSKFWAMHDGIYQHQTELGTDLIDTLVSKLQLDRPRFDADLHARRGRARIRYDFMGGMRSGVAGTPTFFINGERYDGDVHERSLLAALQKQLGLKS
jgi:protein-disulfide isomerase